MIVSADHLFQSIAKYEEKRKIAEKVLPARMNEQGRYEGPDASSIEMVKAKDSILVSPVWVLLPRIQACQDASHHQEPFYTPELRSAGREDTDSGNVRSV